MRAADSSDRPSNWGNTVTMDMISAEQNRFFSLLEIVQREGKMLLKTDARLFKSEVDAAWVERLKNEEDLAERLEAFVSRFAAAWRGCHVSA